MVVGIIFIVAALFLIGYAASCDAKMDTVRDHWGRSIYSADKKKYLDEWFDPTVSWTLKNNFPAYIVLADQYLPDWAFFVIDWKNKVWDPFSDFWHFEKTKMLLSLIGAGVLSLVGGLCMETDAAGLVVGLAVAYYLGAGIVWNETFNYFYNRKLMQAQYKKKWLWIK
jgi:hypothetical protein